MYFAAVDGTGETEYPVDPQFIKPPMAGDHTTEISDVAVYTGNRLSTQSSSEMLYMILGIVLGIMMLLLVIFMVLCGWKQRQQRRMMGKSLQSHVSHRKDA